MTSERRSRMRELTAADQPLCTAHCHGSRMASVWPYGRLAVRVCPFCTPLCSAALIPSHPPSLRPVRPHTRPHALRHLLPLCPRETRKPARTAPHCSFRRNTPAVRSVRCILGAVPLCLPHFALPVCLPECPFRCRASARLRLLFSPPRVLSTRWRGAANVETCRPVQLPRPNAVSQRALFSALLCRSLLSRVPPFRLIHFAFVRILRPPASGVAAFR